MHVVARTPLNHQDRWHRSLVTLDPLADDVVAVTYRINAGVYYTYDVVEIMTAWANSLFQSNLDEAPCYRDASCAPGRLVMPHSGDTMTPGAIMATVTVYMKEVVGLAVLTDPLSVYLLTAAMRLCESAAMAPDSLMVAANACGRIEGMAPEEVASWMQRLDAYNEPTGDRWYEEVTYWVVRVFSQQMQSMHVELRPNHAGHDMPLEFSRYLAQITVYPPAHRDLVYIVVKIPNVEDTLAYLTADSVAMSSYHMSSNILIIGVKTDALHKYPAPDTHRELHNLACDYVAEDDLMAVLYPWRSEVVVCSSLGTLTVSYEPHVTQTMWVRLLSREYLNQPDDK